MTFLTRCEFVLDTGEVLHDETVPCDIGTLEKVEKGIYLPGIGHGVLRISFDPPLVAEIAAVEDET